MSLHKELPRKGSSKVNRRPIRSGRPRLRPTRAALSRNPLFYQLFPGFLPHFNFGEIDVEPVVPQVQKSWRRKLKLIDRAHIIDELIHFFAHIDTEEARIEHATNLEGFMCEAANSMEEYEMLLALFRKASTENDEEYSDLDILSNCSSKREDSDASYNSSEILYFSSEPNELDSFSSDHDSSHYGGSESDY